VGALRSAVAFVAFLLITGTAGFVGSMFPPGEWYEKLKKPSFTPPSSQFAPIWTSLYFLMAMAAWLVWRRRGLVAAGLPLGLFLLQLIFNAAWPWLFFGRHRIGAAFAEMIIMWLLLIATTASFWHHVPLAGILMLPCVFWVAFAAAINWATWRLNP
jgi:benzodiazapine receptor